MASNCTENYGLNQWERSDKVLMEDFNADNEKIDAALGALSLLLGGKADQSALNSLKNTVSSQATTLSRKGTCTAEVLTYTGTGTYGPTGATTITFRKKPVAYIIAGYGAIIVGAGSLDLAQAACKGASSSTVCISLRCSWDGTKVSLWESNATAQANTENQQYFVLALYSES